MMRPNPNDPTPMPISADPARQRCFCGASVCSGFLGGKKKEVERKKESVRGEEKSATPEVEGKAKGKGKAAVKAVVEKMKEAVGAKKTAAKMGGSKPPSAVAGKGKVKPESKASSSSSSKGGPSSAAAKKKAAADVKVVVPKSALVASPAPSGRGKAKPAEVELAFVKSPRRPPTPRG